MRTSAVSFFFFFLVRLVFGATAALELGASTEANPSQVDNSNTVITTEAMLPAPIRELPPELGCNIIIPADYDKAAYFTGSQPALNLYVSSISFSEEQAKVNVTLMVEVLWTDPRLRLAPYSNITKHYYTSAPLTALQHIYQPQTSIWGLASGDSMFNHDISFNRTHQLSWKQWDTECVGCVRFVRATKGVTVQAHAAMHFKFFPNDKHLATFAVAADSYTQRAKVYVWSKTYKSDDTFDIRVASIAFTAALHNESNMDFDFIVLLNRRLETYIYKIYIPSGLFVVLCFLSMLLPAEVAGERVALCATTLLTVTVFFNTAAQSGKAVSYLRPIDIWLLGCTLFVFLILFQSIVIFRLATKKFKKRKLKDTGTGNMMKQVTRIRRWRKILGLRFRSNRRPWIQQEKPGGGPDLPQESAPPYEPTTPATLSELESKTQEPPLHTDEDDDEQLRSIRIIDRISLLVFVIILAVCNGIYWNWLLNSIQQTCNGDEECRLHLIETEEYAKAAQKIDSQI